MSCYVLLFPSTSHGLIKPTATEAQMDGSVSGPIESTARVLPDLPDLGGPLGHFSVVRTCRCWFWYDMVNQLEFQRLVYFTALKVG